MTGIKQWLKMTDQIVKENSYFGQCGVNEICPKMEKLKNFTKVLLSIFPFYLMIDIQKEMKKIFYIFQDNFDYTQRTPHSMFLGRKLTYFVFLVSLLKSEVHCYFALFHQEKVNWQRFILNLSWIKDTTSYGSKRFLRRNFFQKF